MEIAAATPATAIQSLPIDQLKPNPWNRTVFDPEAMKDLVASLKSVGVKEPLIVRPLRAQGSGQDPDSAVLSHEHRADVQYQIASGHRRWLAAKAAGLAEVPCICQPVPDDDVQDFNLIANLNREDLPVLEMSRMVDTRIRSGNLTQEQMAAKLGKSKSCHEFHGLSPWVKANRAGKRVARSACSLPLGATGSARGGPTSWISQLLAFLEFEPTALTQFSALNLPYRTLQALIRLSPDLQIQIANELKAGTLKPEEIVKSCNQLRFGGGKGSKSNPGQVLAVKLDPLADVWPS
jgi:ParB/RepB/Spo0J family partition protein